MAIFNVSFGRFSAFAALQMGKSLANVAVQILLDLEPFGLFAIFLYNFIPQELQMTFVPFFRL